jgi:hypothetical protein
MRFLHAAIANRLPSPPGESRGRGLSGPAAAQPASAKGAKVGPPSKGRQRWGRQPKVRSCSHPVGRA